MCISLLYMQICSGVTLACNHVNNCSIAVQVYFTRPSPLHQPPGHPAQQSTCTVYSYVYIHIRSMYVRTYVSLYEYVSHGHYYKYVTVWVYMTMYSKSFWLHTKSAYCWFGMHMHCAVVSFCDRCTNHRLVHCIDCGTTLLALTNGHIWSVAWW